jgi:hypothetical protein
MNALPTGTAAHMNAEISLAPSDVGALKVSDLDQTEELARTSTNAWKTEAFVKTKCATTSSAAMLATRLHVRLATESTF